MLMREDQRLIEKGADEREPEVDRKNDADEREPEVDRKRC